MRNTRQGFVALNGGESLTLQQIMETMQALQETVAASRAHQEHIHIDLAASLARNEELQRTNEELRRGLRNQEGEREVEDQEPTTPPRDFPMPFSQTIMDAVIPATLVGPKATFTGVEDAEAHLTAFHTQMMLVGGLWRGAMQAIHEHTGGNDDGLVHQPPWWPCDVVRATF